MVTIQQLELYLIKMGFEEQKDATYLKIMPDEAQLWVDMRSGSLVIYSYKDFKRHRCQHYKEFKAVHKINLYLKQQENKKEGLLAYA